LAGGYSMLSFEKFQDICSQIQKFGRVKTIRLWIMGEPLLNKNLVKMINLAKELNISDKIELTTNASALTKELSLQLIESKLDLLKISIYGVDSRHHEITQSNVGVNKIKDNVDYFFKNRTVGVNKVIAKLIDPIDSEQVKLFKEIYEPISDEVQIDSPHSWTDSNDNTILTKVYSSEQLKSMVSSKIKEVCPFPFYTLAIHSDGEVSVCCVDWSKKTSIGNCFKTPLEVLWKSNSLKDFRKMHIQRKANFNSACNGCSYFYNNAPDNIDNVKLEQIE
jgi:radical SAM protein with 4Fe4S-binding SPASM domain